jgi:hypothetical protein
MKYLLVKWLHNFPNEPALIYSELDELSNEVRKIEIFPDGSKGFASATENCGDTELSIEPIPDITEIMKDGQFQPKEINNDEFEKAWRKRKRY